MIHGIILHFALLKGLGIEVEQQVVHMGHLALLKVILLIILVFLEGQYQIYSFQDRTPVLVVSALTILIHFVLTCPQNGTLVQVTLISQLDPDLSRDQFPMKDTMVPLAQAFTIPQREKVL